MPRKKQEPDWNERAVEEVTKQGAVLRGSTREAKNPAKAVEMVADLLSMMPRSKWQEKYNISGTEYAQFRDRYMPLITERKEWLARNNVKVAQMAQELQMKKMEQLEADPEELKKVNVRDLAMTANLAVQGFTQLTEGNRVVVEHQRGATLEDAAALVAAAKERARAKLMGQAVEVVVEDKKD